jgi:hypothetical protein
MYKRFSNSTTPKLIGFWYKHSNEYVNETSNVKLLIVNRKHQTENKPTRYALMIHSTNEREYLSGIFPTDEPNKYRIDYKGKNYIITFNETTIFEITKK